MDGEFGQFRDVRNLWTRLWREIYGEPPPLADDPQLLSRILVESLPPLPPYELGKTPPRDTTDPRDREPEAGISGTGERPHTDITPSRADPSD
jgi:hypothetical protein